MERQCSTAFVVAHWLQEHPWVERVYYPGLSDSPDYSLARRLLGGHFGGMVSFDLRTGREETLRFLDGLTLVTPGTSLGDVVTLALYPPLSSHRSLDDRSRARAGIGDGLVRLSVGLEAPDDLCADLAAAARLIITTPDTMSTLSTATTREGRWRGK